MFSATWPSEIGKTYKLERSTDLLNWQNLEEGIPGTGESIQRFAPILGPKAFLRVSEE